jgi:hypothetical protein
MGTLQVADRTSFERRLQLARSHRRRRRLVLLARDAVWVLAIAGTASAAVLMADVIARP